MKHFTIVCISAVLLLFACKTELSVSTLKFDSSLEEVTGQLEDLDNFEEVDITTNFNWHNGKSTNTVKMKLINGDRPLNDTNLNQLGQSAVDLLKDGLSNAEDFDKFEVSVIKEKGDKVPVSNSKTFTYE